MLLHRLTGQFIVSTHQYLYSQDWSQKRCASLHVQLLEICLLLRLNSSNTTLHCQQHVYIFVFSLNYPCPADRCTPLLAAFFAKARSPPCILRSLKSAALLAFEDTEVCGKDANSSLSRLACQSLECSDNLLLGCTNRRATKLWLDIVIII
jgi:hypothetical protein